MNLVMNWHPIHFIWHVDNLVSEFHEKIPSMIPMRISPSNPMMVRHIAWHHSIRAVGLDVNQVRYHTKCLPSSMCQDSVRSAL